MPFDAVTLGYLEDALAECFYYHQGFDSFVLRSGIPERYLVAARENAENRARVRADASGRINRAPKRFVAQQLLIELGHLGDDGDRFISNLITGITRSVFNDASPDGLSAAESLKAQIEADRKLKREKEEQKAAETRHREADQDRQQEVKRAANEKRRLELRQSFLDLIDQTDVQARGYMLEKFLTEVFDFEKLNPRSSFRLVGEQIDGSFTWRGGTHLTEAKWHSTKVAGAEFGALMFKIEGKSADTRGLFIAINGYTEPAIQALSGKGDLKFVCLDGAHLMRAFEPTWSLVRVLGVVWRHADETGNAYLPISDFPT